MALIASDCGHLQVSLDPNGEFVGSCSDEGLVVITPLYSADPEQVQAWPTPRPHQRDGVQVDQTGLTISLVRGWAKQFTYGEPIRTVSLHPVRSKSFWPPFLALPPPPFLALPCPSTAALPCPSLPFLALPCPSLPFLDLP